MSEMTDQEYEIRQIVLDELRMVFAVMLNNVDEERELFPGHDKIPMHMLGTILMRKRALEQSKRMKPEF